MNHTSFCAPLGSTCGFDHLHDHLKYWACLTFELSEEILQTYEAGDPRCPIEHLLCLKESFFTS